jgi:hypothetical protein
LDELAEAPEEPKMCVEFTLVLVFYAKYQLKLVLGIGL